MAEIDSGCAHKDKSRFLEQIADSMREIIWISDATGDTLCYINPAVEKVLGRRVRDLYRNPSSWHDSLHPDDRDNVEIFSALAGGSDTTEFRILRPDGETRWLWLHRTAVRGDGHKTVGVVGVVEDITERKRAEEALRLKKLEDENRRLKQLVADQALDIQMLKFVAEGNW